MKGYPHHYQVSAAATEQGADVLLSSAGLESLVTAPPAEFDGPGDRWSPESLLVGSIADCLIMTFRAIARASKIEWTSLDCDVVGTLDRDQGVTRFSEYAITARWVVPAGTDLDAAERAVHKAEEKCLISNSLTGKRVLSATVEVAA
jgi:organic hydroperoxide reductase OsmC/OhrA